MTLKPYLKYKDSGVEWLGKVPEHWDIVQSRRLFSERKEKAKQEDIQLTVSQKYGILPQTEFMSLEGRKVVQVIVGSDILKHVNCNDFVISMRSFQGGLELCRYSGSISSAYVPLIPIKKVVPNFFYYLFKSEPYIKALQTTSNLIRDGQALRFENFSLVPLPIVPDNEQTTIATYLDQETARIDELIAQKTRFIELLKEKRSALITHAVTKGLNADVKMKDSGLEWLGQVPEHWEVKRLKFVATYQNSNVDKKTYDDQKLVRLCNYTDVYYNEFITDSMDFMEATASDSEVKSFSLEQGNIIITKDSEDPTDIGIPAIVAEPLFNVVCGYHLTIIRTTKDNCASFVFRVLQSHPTKAQFYVESPGITRFGLGQDTIGGLSLALPPIAEQTAIATYLDQETARIDELLQLTEKSINLIKERRSALITAAVTGKIDVSEQGTIGV